jgi:pimeloyl-ACP methyl ester carboxylesterase
MNLKTQLRSTFWLAVLAVVLDLNYVAAFTVLVPTASSSRIRQENTQLVSNVSRCLSNLMTATEAPVELSVADYSCSIESEAPPVILLHGLLGSKRNFASLGTALAQQLRIKRQVLALDLRNHGESDWRNVMTYDEMALDVVTFMEKQGIREAVLVAHSMGGKVAQTLALLHPDRVAGLVVLDMAPVTYSDQDAAWKAVKDIIHVLADLDLRAAKSKRDIDVALRASIPDPALRAFVLTNLDQQNMKWKINMEAIASQLHELAGFSVVGRQYSGDAFFIHGGQSKFVRHAYMDAIAGFFPNHMLTTIRGAGHWIHAEAPDDVIALLKQYLDR